MRLQKASSCALFAVLELARDPRRQLSATDIADKYGISANHLAKVLRDLGRAGLVESVRGAGGGYRFCGNAKRTTLLDLIDLFENIGHDDAGRMDTGADTEIGQALAQVLCEIDDITRAVLKSVTLATLLKTTPNRAGNPAEAPDGGNSVEAAN